MCKNFTEKKEFLNCMRKYITKLNTIIRYCISANYNPYAEFYVKFIYADSVFCKSFLHLYQ